MQQSDTEERTPLKLIWEPRRAILWALEDDGETQAELARRAGIDPSKLNRLLKGKAKTFDINVLSAIAAAQGRDLDYYTEAPIIHGMTLPDWVHRPIEAWKGHGNLRAA